MPDTLGRSESDKIPTISVEAAAARKGCGVEWIRKSIWRGFLNGEKEGRFWRVVLDEKFAAFILPGRGKQGPT